MALLLYTHARKAGIALPEETWLQLQGLALRHQFASRERARLVVEILAASQAAGIEVILLKGAALGQIAYPDPALRPMRNIDLLTRPRRARDLQNLLVEMGYRPAPHAPGSPISARHLDELSKQTNGFRVTVEIHDCLFDPTWRARRPEIDAWMDRARPFSYNGVPAYTLNPKCTQYCVKRLKTAIG